MSVRVSLASAAFTMAVVCVTAQSPASQKPQTPQTPQTPPAAQDPQRPVFRTEANFVRVDVFPTKDGAPVKDLSQADFEVLEDGVPQKVETFEFVQVSAGMARRAARPEHDPGVAGCAQDPRARVFVLFLDVPHVTIAWRLEHPRAAGPADRPDPRARRPGRHHDPDDGRRATSSSPARREVIAGGLRDRWPWGERFTLAEDEREMMYKACYPWPETQAVVAEMTARRRERTTLDAHVGARLVVAGINGKSARRS